MNAKMIVVTAIAVISATVAIVEGVMLSHRPTAAPPAVVAQAPADRVPVESPTPAPGPVQNNSKPPAEPAAQPVAPPAPKATPTLPSEVPDLVAPPAPTATAAATATSAEPVLTDEEKAARDKALAKAKMQEAMTLQMDQATNQMIDRLKLTDAQKQLAAPTIEKLHQTMIQLATGPMNAGNDLAPKIAAIRQNGLLAHLSQDQIDAQVKAEQAKITAQIQDQVVGGMANLSTTLNELRPVLDVTQSATVDQMQKEITQQQAMMKKMMGAMTAQPDAPIAPNAP